MTARMAQLALALAVTGTTALLAQQGPPMPKPGPEHALLKMDAGTWDAVIEMVPAPGAPATKSKGVETNRMGCGGLCLISDFKAEVMGMPFEGHGLTTWDPTKKKYVGSWTDSMSKGLAVGESTYDAATKKWEGTLEGPDMEGKIVKSRTVGEMPNSNTRVFTMYSAGPDGKESQSMKITYTKRKG